MLYYTLIVKGVYFFMTESRRQEVFNVVLAQLLQERGVVAAPESIIKSGAQKRRQMPDVLVIYQGLRTAIEGEVESASAREKALSSAQRRVESGLAHMGIAVVYPEKLRSVDFDQLETELANAQLQVAVTSEAGTTGFVTGTVDYLERALRSTFEQLIKEDVVAQAVALLDEAVDSFATVALFYPVTRERIVRILDESLSDEEVDNLSDRQKGAYCRIAGLILMNAMIFQNMLAEHNKKITSIEDVFAKQRRPLDIDVNDFPVEWQYILDRINYYSIFHLARRIFLKLLIGQMKEVIRFMARNAAKITENRAALRHDLMGRVYHRLLADAKYLGTYYTSIPAATILLKLALRPEDWPTKWDMLKQIEQLRIADLSCGTGTLLMAAADATLDNYISASAAAGKPVKLDKIHKAVAESMLYGYDVLPSAIHLTASTLALRSPDTLLKKMNLFSLPLGGQFHRLGSIEFLRGRAVQMPLDLFGALPTTQKVTGQEVEEIVAAPMPDLDLCVMNPPFVRSVGGNLLFGSVPEKERTEMQTSLKKLVDSSGVHASITAGLGSVFVAIGDRYLKEKGRLALVLPKALLSGVAWGKTRQLINQKYRLDCVIVSHDAERWNFSESTDLSEVLLIATKLESVNGNGNGIPANGHQVVVINLWHNPRTALEALAIEVSLKKDGIPDLIDQQGVFSIRLGRQKVGEAITYPWLEMQADWFLPCAFAQADLTRSAYHLLKGNVWLPGFGKKGQIKLCSLTDLGALGPDRRDIHDGFEVSESVTSFPTFWGHDAEAMNTLAQKANKYLSPLSKAKETRSLRKVEALWPLAGKILIAERMWLKTQKIVSVRLPQRVLSNVWWPFAFKQAVEKPDFDKALVLWLNSTFGLLILFATRDETRGAWVDFKKPSLGAMPILDLRTLSPEQLKILADAYDRVCEKPLQPFPQMADDDVRAEIDHAIAQALGLPDFSILRTMLGREPVVSMKRLE
jgi:hypothetical protein